MDTIKSPFTATATATGGRNGHTEANDGSVRPDLGSKKAATDCREVVHKRQITVAVVDDDPRGKCDEGLFHGGIIHAGSGAFIGLHSRSREWQQRGFRKQ